MPNTIFNILFYTYSKDKKKKWQYRIIIKIVYLNLFS